jgi:hypothetical protein
MARTRVISAIAIAAATVGGSGLAATPIPAGQALPLDKSVSLGSVDVACTGIGQTRDDPKWRDFPVRVEFSDARNWYLVGATVLVEDAKGRAVANVSCDAPWILLKLPAGAYKVFGRLNDSPAKPRSAPFKTPAKTQLRVVLQFRDA